MIKSLCITLRALHYRNFGIFLLLGNAGIILINRSTPLLCQNNKKHIEPYFVQPLNCEPEASMPPKTEHPNTAGAFVRVRIGSWGLLYFNKSRTTKDSLIIPTPLPIATPLPTLRLKTP